MDMSLSQANYQWIGSCHQQPVRVLSHIPTRHITVWWLQQTTDPWTWLSCIRAIYTVICNQVVLLHIEPRVSHATPDIRIQGPICADQYSMDELRVDSYKSIWSTGLRYIDYRLSTYILYDSAYLKMSDALILTAPHLSMSKTLEHEWIVIWSATRNKVSCWYGVTINYRDPTAIIDPKIMHIIFAVGLIAVVDRLMWRSGKWRCD